MEGWVGLVVGYRARWFNNNNNMTSYGGLSKEQEYQL